MYPRAINPKKIGKYPALTKSGGGYFYDDVLEYRVWVHPPDGDDLYHAFDSYEEALDFSQVTKGAEEPLVLVMQLEHVNEPKTGVFEHVKGERIAEWLPRWLEGSKRGPDSIMEFIKKGGRPART
jgi:putative acetyltransferase